MGEASALAIKAARGVGMPWGIAEEAGFALRWLTRSGGPGIAALCRYLSAYQDTPKMSGAEGTPEAGGAWICPLRLGSAISDGGISLPLAQSGVREPLLLLPFLASSGDRQPFGFAGNRRDTHHCFGRWIFSQHG